MKYFFKQLIKKNYTNYWLLHLKIFKSIYFFKKIYLKYFSFIFFLKKNIYIFFLENLNYSFLIISKKNNTCDYNFKYKLKKKLYFFLSKTKFILNFKGRGYKLNEIYTGLLTFKVGFSHNLRIEKNKKIEIQNLSKNFQKFEVISELPYILQFFSCFRFIKNSNKFTNKGLFFDNENFILKKSTKASW